MKLEFSRQIFEKYSDIKLHEHPSSESLDIRISNFTNIRPARAWIFRPERRTEGETDRWTDRHNETNSRMTQFYERA